MTGRFPDASSMPEQHAGRSFAARPALVLGALALIAYWPLLIGRIPLPAHIVTRFPPWESVGGPAVRAPAHAEMGDLVTELYPWKVLTKRAVSGGMFPLWNPHLLLGAPFVGDPQTGLFYPVNAPYYVLPTPVAWALAFPLRVFLAGMLMTLMGRALGATHAGSLLAGIVFAFCGWVTAFQARPHLDTCLWLPLVIFSLDRLQRRPAGSSVALAAAALALPVLAGQPESAAHVTVVALLFFLYRAVLPPPLLPSPASRARFVLLFASTGLLALGLAAVQTLPALEFIGQLNRGLDVVWPHKPLHEAAAFVSRDLAGNPNSAGVSIPEAAGYVGMLSLLLAPLALLHRNRRDAIFFVVLLAAVLQIVYGRGPAYWLSLHTPVLRGIPNGRLLAVADFALAALAGLGLSAVQDADGIERLPASWWVLSGGAAAAGAAMLAWILTRPASGSHAAKLLSFASIRGPVSSAVALGAAAALLAAALARWISPGRFAGLVLALTAVDLLSAGYRFIPFMPPRSVFPPNPTFRFLGQDPEPHRVASVDATYGPGFELPYGLESATGFNVVVQRTERLLGALGFQPDSPYLRSEAIVSRSSRVLDLMNVRYLVATTWNRGAANLGGERGRFQLVFSDASVRVFENLKVLPRAFLVPAWGIEVLPSESAQFARVTSADFDPARAVVLPEPAPIAFRGQANPALPPGISGFVQGVNEIRLVASVAEPSILVLSQTHYSGWRVEVDGARAPLLRADYGFDGVAVTPGRHMVRFALEPNSLRIGAMVTGASLVVLVVLLRARRAP